ncbi:ferredoxin [Planctomycetaceae bacterium SCGC AG-212-F19]|nr:ferredoxin [Planctomycetaceae bacterium SCGC AG-212-F19]
MATVIVNDKPVDIGADKLNLIQAAERAGVLIPHYCWHPALTVVASCRMCLVEVGEKKPDGTVAMQPKVVPACQTPAKDGTIVITNSPRAKAAQQQTLEGLLLNHPLDCPVCDKAGECLLQDYTYKFGRATSRMIDEKNQPPNKEHIGEHIKLFTDRCVMCSRCVRFTREIAGTAELQVINRGEHSEIDIFPGEPCNNKLAGNVVDLCPVGALGNKDFLYKQRVWYLHPTHSVCADCSTGCAIDVDANKDIVFRLRPRFNPQAQGHFMCDEGRFGFHYVQSAERFLRPARRAAGFSPADRPNGEAGSSTWETILPEIRQKLAEAISKDGSGVAAMLSPFLTCEEAYLAARFFKGLSGEVRLFLGPVPIVGEDDTYPKDRKGNPPPPDHVKFTIRAEKCPNRKGVEEILRHFQGEVIEFSSLLRFASEGKLQAVYLLAGYPPRPGGWISTEDVAKLQNVPLVIVHDLFPSPASALAHYVLPSAVYAEKDGTFVNHAGLAQLVRRAIRPPGEIRTEGQFICDLMQRRGLAHAPTIRAELAAEVKHFAALAGDLGEYGVRLQPQS